jgi:radical SAM-linked protein
MRPSVDTHRIKVTFSKTGEMRYISHLDLVRLFQRASRRADLAVVITKGFSPRLKISITRALGVGKESVCEEALFYMEHSVEPEDFLRSLNTKLPEGIRILRAERL